MKNNPLSVHFFKSHLNTILWKYFQVSELSTNGSKTNHDIKLATIVKWQNIQAESSKYLDAFFNVTNTPKTRITLFTDWPIFVLLDKHVQYTLNSYNNFVLTYRYQSRNIHITTLRLLPRQNNISQTTNIQEKWTSDDS